MVIVLLPQCTLPAQASESYSFDLYHGNISITSDTVTYYDSSGEQSQAFSSGTELVITQTESDTASTANAISVNGGTAVINIILSGVNIRSSGCALELQGTSNVNLTLADGTTNVLKSGSVYAGLQVPANTAITIDGSGILSTDGGTNAAGIGGYGGYNSCSTQGGNGGNGSLITINSGTITANGNIGGGYGGSGRNGSIAGFNGANGGNGSCEITGGSFYVDISKLASTPTNGSNTVYLTTVGFDSVATEGSVFSLTMDAAYAYGTHDMLTDANGELYIWLPDGTKTTEAQTVAGNYSGSILTTTDITTSLGTLSKVEDSEKPIITSVTPNEDNAPLNSEISITFSEPMNTSVSGAISLDSGVTTLTGGAWSNFNQTYTVSYSGLSNNTTYTIGISGYTDSSSNIMDEDITHSFRTMSSCGNGAYLIASDSDSAYTDSYTNEGLLNLTVNEGVSGLTYFSVNVSAVTGHASSEVCLFVHVRNSVQVGIMAFKGDFESGGNPCAAFNVQTGDVIEVYIVDELTNDASSNPTVL
ncbi:MAG: Ig-like domain-containing protein [Bacillota bacterium]|nr:Ig-like domain-containing protein [Bacillota bacterium]